MSDITVINDSEQSSLVTNGLAKNGELYLKAAGSTDAGAIIVYDSGVWRTFANEGGGLGAISNAYSVSFDGTNDYMSIGNVTEVNSASDLSISFWFNLNVLPDVNSAPIIIGSSNFWNQISDAGFRYWNGTATNTSYSFSTGVWYHTVMAQAGTTLKVYVNGGLEGTHTVNAISSTAGNNLTVGKWSGGNYNKTNGYIDEVSVFNSALSASDITEMYSTGVPVDLTSLTPVGWWRMGDNDSGTGTTVTDQGSGSNNGTLINGAAFSSSVPS